MLNYLLLMKTNKIFVHNYLHLIQGKYAEQKTSTRFLMVTGKGIWFSLKRIVTKDRGISFVKAFR